MTNETKQQPIDVSELQYYFDAVERDSLDRLNHSRRSSEVLAIRDHLLALPDKDFEQVMQTIKNLLQPHQKSSQSEEPKLRRREAQDLYEQSRLDKPRVVKIGPV